eukprot:gb/GECG01008678.1/.p1 GENE.gb/GECG01008678.1/~~gb/GECG01008678.1/.p1  ORF type:complete len:426 (+),score=45.74 gb/GECG01008678.1/:1-1278(+)
MNVLMEVILKLTWEVLINGSAYWMWETAFHPLRRLLSFTMCGQCMDPPAKPEPSYSDHEASLQRYTSVAMKKARLVRRASRVEYVENTADLTERFSSQSATPPVKLPALQQEEYVAMNVGKEVWLISSPHAVLEIYMAPQQEEFVGRSVGLPVELSRCWSRILEARLGTGTIYKTEEGSAVVVVGQVVFVSIVGCYTTGTIRGYVAGGICGERCGSQGKVSILNSYSAGVVDSAVGSGGICGGSCAADEGFVNITDCYSAAFISAEAHSYDVGGIIGRDGGEDDNPDRPGTVEIRHCVFHATKDGVSHPERMIGSSKDSTYQYINHGNTANISEITGRLYCTEGHCWDSRVWSATTEGLPRLVFQSESDKTPTSAPVASPSSPHSLSASPSPWPSRSASVKERTILELQVPQRVVTSKKKTRRNQ